MKRTTAVVSFGVLLAVAAVFWTVGARPDELREPRSIGTSSHLPSATAPLPGSIPIGRLGPEDAGGPPQSNKEAMDPPGQPGH